MRDEPQFAMFDPKTGSLRSFPVEFNASVPITATDHNTSHVAGDLSLLLDCGRGTVDFFKHTTAPNLNWRHARYSLSGEQLQTSAINQCGLYHDCIYPPAPVPCRPIASGYDMLYNIGNALIWPGKNADEGSHHPYRIRFDAKTAQLRREYLTGSKTELQAEVMWKDILFHSGSQAELITQNLVSNEPYALSSSMNRTLYTHR